MFVSSSMYDMDIMSYGYKKLNPCRAPEPLPILNPSNFVPKNGFPVVKGLSSPHFRLCTGFRPSAERRLGVNLTPLV